MANRLSGEKSPYLLQHAGNPVNWFAWDEAAFAKARAEGKPIFLSIGYSTCHWCHVMAHESFENPEVAAVLNEFFVSIKVDREERPDVDRVYMTFVQATTGHGGWPLSAWLTPELLPFFGGTYFPPEDRYGRAGFRTLLQSIARAWREDRPKLLTEAKRVIDALRAPGARSGNQAEGDLTETAGEAFEACFGYFAETFDRQHGGFGGAPKFPRASNLNFLFRVAAIQGQDTAPGRDALAFATITLQRMAEGGIHDHVGGGFHRYAVDGTWFVPHFEKMLYDQAQIAMNYLDAFQMTRREVFLWVARDILDYVARKLTAPGGGFYSAEDADSLVEAGRPEHAEGAFYVWTTAQIEAALGSTSGNPDEPSAMELLQRHFGLSRDGNVPPELDQQHEFAGKNILMQRHAFLDTARALALDPERANAILVHALEKLRVAREARPHPHLDDKIITAWNGLMISAYARAAQVLRARAGSFDSAARAQEESLAAKWTGAAERAAQFVREKLFDPVTGKLYRSFREERAAAEAFAEDFAFLIQGLLDLHETTFDVGWLRWAWELQSKMDEAFWDESAGGYYQSRADDASIVLRLKDEYDGAEPAANSVAAMNLLRLEPIAGREREGMERRARRTLIASRHQWTQHPQAVPQTLCALEYALTPRRQVVIGGNPQADDFLALWRETQRVHGPRCAVFGIDGSEDENWLADRAPWLSEISRNPNAAIAFVCEHDRCLPPVTSPAELRAQLG